MPSAKTSLFSGLFLGEYDHALDAQCRVSLPSDWRSRDGETELVMIPARGKALVLLPIATFLEFVEKAKKLAIANPKMQMAFAYLGSRSRQCRCDKQGRIALDRRMLDEIGVKGQLKLIGANLEKKVKGELERLLRDDREKYESFWQSFGRQIKLSAMDNYGAKKEMLQDLMLFYSSTEKKLVTLAEYVSRMQEGQKYIYFASGDTVDAVDHIPQTELLKERGMEILYFTDKADEFLPDVLQKYQDKPFRSATDGDLELPGEEEKKEQDEQQYKEAFAFIKETLAGKVDEVKASARLKTHPVCLSSGEGVTFEMEKYFKAAQPELGLKAKRILEINVDHPAFLVFEAARLTDPERAKKYAEIFYNQAQLIAGLPIDDPTAYTDLLCSLWQ